MKKLLLLATLIIAALGATAETWTPVGQVKWTEGFGLTSYLTGTWEVTVEQSDERPAVFRCQPYPSQSSATNFRSNVYVYIHTENPQKVYLEPFTHPYYDFYSSSYRYKVTQRCPENDYDTNYYGTTLGTTITFQAGSFALYEPYWARTSYSSSEHKIEFPAGIIGSVPERFVNIGTGIWQESYINNGSDFPSPWEVSVEKSVTRPGVYRITPYAEPYAVEYYGESLDTQIVIHTEDDKVYAEPFEAFQWRFTQQVPENGVSGSAYGTFQNGRIFLGDGFDILRLSDNASISESGFGYILTLPGGYDEPVEAESGIFMGIIAFRDKLEQLPISELNADTKQTFMDFVDEQTMGNRTLLYMAVESGIEALSNRTYPDNLSNVVLITFTDGLDQGSTSKSPEYKRTARTYAAHLAEVIADTKIQGLPINAYTIGLKGEDAKRGDEEFFDYNMQSLASAPENAHSVEDIDEVNAQLTTLFEDINRKSTRRDLSIIVPNMNHGSVYRLTLDNASHATTSQMYIEGTYDIDDDSLNELKYVGFTCASGTKLLGTSTDDNGIEYVFTDCRSLDGDFLQITPGDVVEWEHIVDNRWQPNSERFSENDFKPVDLSGSSAIMFCIDCSNSLGDVFTELQHTAKSFIDRLAGGDGNVGAIEDVNADSMAPTDLSKYPVEYYTLQGIRVTNPGHGIYIRRQGPSVSKVALP